jgi:hypothetical protein
MHRRFYPMRAIQLGLFSVSLTGKKYKEFIDISLEKHSMGLKSSKVVSDMATKFPKRWKIAAAGD